MRRIYNENLFYGTKNMVTKKTVETMQAEDEARKTDAAATESEENTAETDVLSSQAAHNADNVEKKGKKRKSADSNKPKMTAKDWVMLVLGVLGAGIIRAISVYFFVVPNEFAPGGVTGLASMLENKIPGHPSSGYFLIAMNVPLLIIAFIFLGKRFGIISGCAIILSSALLPFMQWLKIPVPTEHGWQVYGTVEYEMSSVGYRILSALAGGIVGGLGVAIMLKLGGSCGGTDIVATIIQRKHSATNVTWFIFMLDSTVVVASFFVYGFDVVPVLLSFIEMFASSKVAEIILQGFKSALKFEIITSHPEELSKEIMERLRRGVTSIPAKGMYTGEEKAMLVCVLRKRQLSQFKAILNKYPDTFAYLSGTSEVVGRGFN